IVGFINTVLSMIAGDLSAKFLHKVQPDKLAAYEWHYDTQSHANLVLFGVLNEKTHEVSGALEIPGLLSFLADNSFNTKVKGLNEFPKNELPPMIVHYFFDLMVSMGIFCFIISGLYMLFLIVKKLRKYVTSSVMLYAILLTGPASMLAIEFGWFLTEMGRQPWIIRGYMRVSEAATQAGGITLVTTLFGLLYLLLLVTSAYVLIRMFKNQPAYKDVEKVIEERGETK
ncbi:MAG: cytochrome ubiquinol oxidase subunit I, partial [Staphylococcus epidermidis]|nr:cytochrome ubiquinol oxidase subunit I [Staphylococcus epidermidis]